MPTQTKPPTLDPEPGGRLPVAADNISRTDPHAIPAFAWAAYEASLESILASDAADNFVIAIQVSERLGRAGADPSYWTPVEDSIREHGLDPADFGL